MSYKILSGNVESILDQLNGVVSLPIYSRSGLPIGGRTLIFSSPAVTVTFSGAVGDIRTPTEIVSEINSAIGSTIATRVNIQNAPAVNNPEVDALVNVKLQRDAGFTISSAGTANPYLKLSTTANTVSAGIVPQVKIAGFNQGISNGHLCVLIAP